MQSKKVTAPENSGTATTTSDATTRERLLAVFDNDCVVCGGLLDRDHEVCSRCIDAFVVSTHHRRNAACRLPVLDHSGVADPWGWSA